MWGVLICLIRVRQLDRGLDRRDPTALGRFELLNVRRSVPVTVLGVIVDNPLAVLAVVPRDFASGDVIGDVLHFIVAETVIDDDIVIRRRPRVRPGKSGVLAIPLGRFSGGGR